MKEETKVNLSRIGLSSHEEGSKKGSYKHISRTNYVFIGQSAAFASINETIHAIAPRDCSVIITGETGTGKEMVARKIHVLSQRRDKVFVPVDCTTLTGQLFESQLFGHAKGAFTGAFSDTLGFFRAANGGTIFLDEISEMPVDLQVKLLRVLQEGHVYPLGSVESYPVDARIICATNRDLRELTRVEKFRADLYYRLNVVNVEVPPLRERPDDIAILMDYYLEMQAEFYQEPKKQFTDAAMELLLNYSWPGNVRELANVVERSYVLCKSNKIGPSALPADILINDILIQSQDNPIAMDEVNKKLILRALEITKGRKMATAKLLKIDHRKLGRLIEKYNLHVSK